MFIILGPKRHKGTVKAEQPAPVASKQNAEGTKQNAEGSKQ